VPAHRAYNAYDPESLRLNVTASEAASLKILLHALRQAALVQESREIILVQLKGRAR
jgi:hypothetical protein